MCLVQPQCAAVFLCPISSMLRCALAGRAQRQRPGGNLMRITLPHACSVTESPLSGQSKLLSLVQRSGTSARIASTGRCGRLEDNFDATTLRRQCQHKSNSTFPHVAAGRLLGTFRVLGKDESTARKDVKIFYNKKGRHQGRPQGSLRLDWPSQVGLSAARLGTLPPTTRCSATGAPITKQLTNHSASLDNI